MTFDRSELEKEFYKESRLLALITRDRLDLPQSKMAEALLLQENSYSNLETGRFGCSALTLFLLLTLQEDPTAWIREIEKKLKRPEDER